MDPHHRVLVDQRLHFHAWFDDQNQSEKNVEQHWSLGRSPDAVLPLFLRHVSNRSVGFVDGRIGLEQWRLHRIFDQPFGFGAQFRGHITWDHQQHSVAHGDLGTTISGFYGH